MAALTINEYYGCSTCKSASTIYGQGCKHGLLFPVVLIMSNRRNCPNYEFDKHKVEQQIKK